MWEIRHSTMEAAEALFVASNAMQVALRWLGLMESISVRGCIGVGRLWQPLGRSVGRKDLVPESWRPVVSMMMQSVRDPRWSRGCTVVSYMLPLMFEGLPCMGGDPIVHLMASSLLLSAMGYTIYEKNSWGSIEGSSTSLGSWMRRFPWETYAMRGAIAYGLGDPIRGFYVVLDAMVALNNQLGSDDAVVLPASPSLDPVGTCCHRTKKNKGRKK